MNRNVKLDNKKELSSIKIQSLSHDGRGIATIDQKTTFVSGALPDEIVQCKLTSQRSTYNEAEVTSVTSASSERVTPPCKHFGLCGGCNLQHMSATAQLQMKEQTLLEQLQHFGRVQPDEILAPLNAHSLGYRHKARLGVKFVIKKNKMLVGFREKSSSYLAELDECVVLHPRVGLQLRQFADLILSLEIMQQIPQIEVAIGDNDIALVFRHLANLSEQDQQKLIAFATQYQFQIYLQPNPPAPVTKLWPQDNNERLTYTLPDFKLEFLFHPLDFTQINLDMNRLMVKQAVSLLDIQSDDTVLDLFCGIGNFTLPLARYAKTVTGIEGGEEMVKRGSANALHNNIHNVEFYAANLMEPEAIKHAWIKKQYDKILLDPPRAGAKEMLPYIKHFKAKKIVYVSCNPATLARDAGELVHTYGYRLTKAGIMNMFPHTAHIEAMAVFEKN